MWLSRRCKANSDPKVFTSNNQTFVYLLQIFNLLKGLGLHQSNNGKILFLFQLLPSGFKAYPEQFPISYV